MAKAKKKVYIKNNYNDYIIAVDISLNDSGVAVYSLSQGKIVHTGNCNTSAVRSLKKYRGYNLNAIKLNIQREFFEDIKRRYPPKIVVFEAGFAKFKKEVESLNQVNGVIYSIFWNYTQVKYSPTAVKAEIVHGRAEKNVVRDVLIHNVKELRGDEEFYNNDNISDAVAVLYTYLLKERHIPKAKWNKMGHVKKVAKKKRVAKQPDKNIIY